MGLEDSLRLVGQEIHDCKVVRMVGEGGFAIVYEGTHKPTGARVAIKCLKRPEGFSTEQWTQLIEKFEDECRLLRQLGKLQPAIVRVLAAGKYARGGSKSPYMVMEWLDGIPLDAALRKRIAEGKGPFPEHKALAVAESLLQTLSTAHEGLTDEAGVTRIVAHRDIKPENLFYLENNEGLSLKLIDFGIAKLRHDGPERGPDQPGVVTMFQAFSPAYAAPEQFSKNYGETGTWTDVYAVGLLLTEMVTGRRALDGDDVGTLFMSTIQPLRPTPRRRGAVVSDAIEELCQRALAITPTERYRDAPEMLAALRRLRSVTRPTSRRGGPVSSSSTPSEPVTSSTAPLSSSGPHPSRREPPLPVSTPPTHQASTARYLIPMFLLTAAAVGGMWAFSRNRPANLPEKSLSTPRTSRTTPSAGMSASPPPVAAPSAPASVSAAASSSAPPPLPGAPLVSLSGGEITAGTPGESPRMVVVNPFRIDRREVIVTDYEACVQAAACARPRTYAQCTWGHPAKRTHPINCVTWSEATAYCTWAKKRLPTAEEWELAARGTDGRLYPWGNELPSHQTCWSSDITCESGALPGDQTPEKVLDLAGNVSEWTASPACPGPPPCKPERKAIRGGHFGEQNARNLQGNAQTAEQENFHAASLGFRCAADALP